MVAELKSLLLLEVSWQEQGPLNAAAAAAAAAAGSTQGRPQAAGTLRAAGGCVGVAPGPPLAGTWRQGPRKSSAGLLRGLAGGQRPRVAGKQQRGSQNKAAGQCLISAPAAI